jgi:hypothetical protein
LTRTIRAEKAAAQLVKVTVRAGEREEAQRLTQGLMTVAQQWVDRYHDQGIPAVGFRVVADEPWVGETHWSAPITGSAVFVLMFFLVVNAALLWASFKHLD